VARYACISLFSEAPGPSPLFHPRVYLPRSVSMAFLFPFLLRCGGTDPCHARRSSFPFLPTQSFFFSFRLPLPPLTFGLPLGLGFSGFPSILKTFPSFTLSLSCPILRPVSCRKFLRVDFPSFISDGLPLGRGPDLVFPPLAVGRTCFSPPSSLGFGFWSTCKARSCDFFPPVGFGTGWLSNQLVESPPSPSFFFFSYIADSSFCKP